MTSMRGLVFIALVVVLAALAGCGGSDDKECTVGDACDNGAYCESYVDSSGMHNACFA
jgi:hypothetical protein